MKSRPVTSAPEQPPKRRRGPVHSQTVPARLLCVISLAAQSAGRAEAAYCRADRRGSMYAASVLARLLKRRGDLSTAEVAYRRAADLDYLDEITHTLNATGNLARFLERRGDLAGTEAVLPPSDGARRPLRAGIAQMLYEGSTASRRS